MSLLILSFLSSCQISYEGGGNTIKIVNRTDSYIAVEFSQDTVSKNLNKVEYYIRKQIKPYDSLEFHGGIEPSPWQKFIVNSVNKKLNVFVYNADTLVKYMNMEQIRRNRLWVVEMSISQSELDSMKWVIVYDGKNR